MRSCINRVAVDCAPLMPSISGSITSSIFPSPGGTAAFENRSLAARSSASSNGAGIGGGGGLGAAGVVGAACGLGAACGKAAVTPTRKQQVVATSRLGFRSSVVTRRLHVAGKSDIQMPRVVKSPRIPTLRSAAAALENITVGRRDVAELSARVDLLTG